MVFSGAAIVVIAQSMVAAIVANAATIVTVATVGAGVLATVNTVKSLKLDKETNKKFQTASVNLEVFKKITKLELEAFGTLKLQLQATTIKNFLDFYEKFEKKINFSAFEKDEYSSDSENEEYINKIKYSSELAANILADMTGGLISGLVLRYGAHSVVSTFALASTGAPIAGLYGAAASNATLAWFGGGAIATAGGGMVLGSAILGAFVAFPMWIASIKGLKKMEERKKKVDITIKEIKNSITIMNNIVDKVENLRIQLYQLQKKVVKPLAFIEVLDSIENEEIQEFQKYFDKVIPLVKKIQTICCLTILDDDGVLNKEI